MIGMKVEDRLDGATNFISWKLRVLILKENPNSEMSHFLPNFVAAEIRVSSFVMIKPLVWLDLTFPQLTLKGHIYL